MVRARLCHLLVFSAGAALGVAGCAASRAAPEHSAHRPGGGVHVVSQAPDDCPVCSLYETGSRSIVRIIRPGSQGAGVVIDNTGRIVTNDHVVGDLDQVAVETSSGTIVRGRVVKRDPAIDLALIETDNPDVLWSPVSIDPHEPVRVGSEVYVIGHPVGLGWTVTVGILSARREPAPQHPGGLLQTDAAVSPGNSGGALLDAHGHLIGIVQSKLSAPDTENVSFAIPLDAVRRFIDTPAAR